MIFDDRVEAKYRDAIEEAAAQVLEKGNKQHKNTARLMIESDVVIRFVPLATIGCSGITGLVDRRSTNRRIVAGELSVVEALSDVHITFADWTFDVAGQRGCQGTLVHEGLHAFDFARIVSSYSKGDDPVVDLSLYQLEHRAAITSAEYLVLIGEPDYIDDGLKLDLVGIDVAGRPFADLVGIGRRMQNGYGLNETNQGIMMSRMLGIKKKEEGFSLGRLLGLGR
ncbi:MAG: hypothetical protein WBD22_03770 [Pyrinomonadaceae bacterium]